MARQGTEARLPFLPGDSAIWVVDASEAAGDANPAAQRISRADRPLRRLECLSWRNCGPECVCVCAEGVEWDDFHDCCQRGQQTFSGLNDEEQSED